MLVELQHHRAGVPLRQVGNVRGVAQFVQFGQAGVGVDVLTERLGDRVVHGLHRPDTGDVDRIQTVIGGARAGPHHHLRSVCGLGGVLNQLPTTIDPIGVVGVRLIGLQQGELRVVAEVDPLVAESPAQLEHPLHSTDAQPLQIELRRDPQVQVEVVAVDVGHERASRGTAVNLLQDRGLDFQKALGAQGFSDGAQHIAASRDQFARFGVDGQVDVAAAHSRFRIGQPLPLVGQRPQALADQSPAANDQ
jgi:hypothetical protein